MFLCGRDFVILGCITLFSADLCYLCQTNFLILSPHCYPSLAWEAVSSPRFWPNGSVVRNKGITQCRPVMRTLIAQAGEPGGTAPPTTNGGNREKCILRPAISWSFPPTHPPTHPPPVYFHTLTLHVGNARRRTYSRSYADRAADRLFSLQFVRVFMAGHLFAGRNIWGTW